MKKCEYRSLPSLKEARNRAASTNNIVDDLKVPEAVKKYAKGRYFFIKTFGCQANIRDEETMAGYLSRAGLVRTLDPANASIAIINTCAVRENAEDKVYGEIGSFKAKAEKDPSFILGVSGCMMQEEGVAKFIEETYPFVSLIFGTHNLPNLLHLLNDVITKRERLVDVLSFPGEVVEGLPSVRLSSFEAYVNISYGCDKFCTYCIVPYTRGKERSRKAIDVVNECKALVNAGYKEITLLGQNVNSYGLDLKDGTSFASLLESVANLGVKRLRFLTSYPSQFTDETIDVMARHDNIVKWLHLPVQSGSDSCLRRMGRRYTRGEYLSLVSRIRAKMPSIALTTDIIVGFPNETEEEFEDTLSLCKEVGYSAAFTFIYSPRKGTPAAAIKDDVSDKTKHERFVRLVEVVEESTAKHSESLIGKTLSVLVEGPGKKGEGMLTGYAECGKPVNFLGPEYLKGALVNVKIKESHTYSLMGELVDDPLIAKAKDVAFLMEKDPLLHEFLALTDKISVDPIYHELGENLVQAKKDLALSMGDEKKHEVALKAYEDVLSKIQNDPFLANVTSLTPLVEEKLVEVRDLLK